jgi:hypothetical protein
MRRDHRLGTLRAAILGVACLAAAIYHVSVLVPLLGSGESAPARVTGVHRGARNSKWAEYEFITSAGQTVQARDAIQMYIRRPEPGDRVVVIYDPANPSVVTADLGVWVWQGAIVFFGGFIILFMLLIAIVRRGRRINNSAGT